MKTLHLGIIIGIIFIAGTGVAFSQSSDAQTQNKTSTYFKCADNMTQNMKTKYASFDQERAKTASINYDKFKLEVKDDKYIFRAVSEEWTNDQVKCNVTFKSALVLFLVTDNSGKQRYVTVLLNPSSYQPVGIDVVRDMATHGGVINQSLQENFTTNFTYGNSVYSQPAQIIPSDADRYCCAYTIPIIVVTLGGVAFLVFLVNRGKIKT